MEQIGFASKSISLVAGMEGELEDRRFGVRPGTEEAEEVGVLEEKLGRV